MHYVITAVFFILLMNPIPSVRLSHVQAFSLLIYHVTMNDFTGKVVRSPYGVMHGKSSPVYYDEKGSNGLFSGLPK